MKQVTDYPQEIQQQIWNLGWIPLTDWDRMIVDIAIEKNVDLIEAACIQVQKLSTIKRWNERGIRRVK